ncbi:hypothetical protein ETAA8_57050 [Anatilimnocola aggregata]|uniref:Carboxypeptidase regulatory-like domain-containing protein n=1 Tax=Anatilimnocola aggregata TaxID=2528021 RepID=A0A517YK07_9BACT|nr:hypothetical protein [Anatilimnocola aggregata]QDU30559.1 hypothetical protein ETAA8_57050 [Anatilimnocola aggregata]
MLLIVRIRRAQWLVIVAALALCSGCDSGPQMGTVEGEVLLDGQPLAEGNVNLEPLDGKTQTAGYVIKNGKFKLKIGLGKARVRITANKVIGEEPVYPGQPNSPMRPRVTELIPKRYNSTSLLEVNVGEGVNPAKFELTSDP